MQNDKLYNRIINSIAKQVKRTLNESIDFDDIDDEDIIDLALIYKEENFVDLGLPSETLWSKCNLGANKPEDTGLYYQWGSIEGHEAEIFNFNNDDYYKHYDKDYYGLKTLREKDDVAYIESGGLSRIPTIEQIKELIKYCKYNWAELNGVKGAKFTGPNENSIFIPAAGYCSSTLIRKINLNVLLWSLMINSANPQNAYYMCCNSIGAHFCSDYRYLGISVRPVCTL